MNLRCVKIQETQNLHSVAGQFPGSIESLIGLYQVILSQHSVRRSGNFRFFLNERDSEQRGDGPLMVHRSAAAKCTIWIDSSPYLCCPLNRRLMNLIRLVGWNSHSENPTSLPTEYWDSYIASSHTHAQIASNTSPPHALCSACLYTEITSEELTGWNVNLHYLILKRHLPSPNILYLKLEIYIVLLPFFISRL